MGQLHQNHPQWVSGREKPVQEEAVALVVRRASHRDQSRCVAPPVLNRDQQYEAHQRAKQFQRCDRAKGISPRVRPWRRRSRERDREPLRVLSVLRLRDLPAADHNLLALGLGVQPEGFSEEVSRCLARHHAAPL